MITAIGCSRFIPTIGYHHVLMMISAIAVIFLSLLYAGCASATSLSNVYLLSLSYSNNSPVPNLAQINHDLTTVFAGIVNGTFLEVRTGYLGLCVSQSIGIWTCPNNAMVLAEKVNSTGVGDPLNLIWLSAKFKDEAFFQGFIPIAICFTVLGILLLSTFPGWHVEIDSDEGSEREIQPFPSRPVSQACMALFSVSFVFLTLTALWQHAVAGTLVTSLEASAYGAIKGHTGTLGITFGWVACSLVCIVAVGILVMILSINVLSSLEH